MRGLNRALGSSKTLGGPVDSGVATAIAETPREDAPTQMSSGQDSQPKTSLPGTAGASDGNLRQGRRVL